MAAGIMYEDGDFCPNCGQFVQSARYIVKTGWCDTCTMEAKWPGRHIVRCISCDRAFPAHIKKLKGSEKEGLYYSLICGSCKGKGVTMGQLRRHVAL